MLTAGETHCCLASFVDDVLIICSSCTSYCKSPHRCLSFHDLIHNRVWRLIDWLCWGSSNKKHGWYYCKTNRMGFREKMVVKGPLISQSVDTDPIRISYWNSVFCASPMTYTAGNFLLSNGIERKRKKTEWVRRNKNFLSFEKKMGVARKREAKRVGRRGEPIDMCWSNTVWCLPVSGSWRGGYTIKWRRVDNYSIYSRLHAYMYI